MSPLLRRIAQIGFLSTGVLAFAAAPRIFYSDLDSGPNTGGENNEGAYVTIFGKGFGGSQENSAVSVGGGRVAKIRVWTDSKVVFQLEAGAVTGNIVVTTEDRTSNPVPFTVRAGRIFFVASKGKDRNSGSFTSPWRTVLKARDSMKPGDITYVRNGVSQSGDDGQGWKSCFTLGSNSGRPGNPKALVVYPGESATIGNINDTSHGGCDTGLRAKGQGESYWTIAGFTLRGGYVAINPYGESGWRIIGNDISCPNGNAQAGCMDLALPVSFAVYGNNIHDVATNLSPGTVTALYHGVYLSDSGHDVDFAWNTIARIQGCRGLQENVNQGPGYYSLHIHDNIIHDTQCDGIVMTTVDPSKGTVELYNNIIYNAGTGPNNAEHTGTWSCMNLQGWDTSGTAPGSGVVEVFGNTMYNCGTFSPPPYGGSNAGLIWAAGGNRNKSATVRNNIIKTPRGVPYIIVYDANGKRCTDTGDCTGVSGSNNLFYGSGPAPQMAGLAHSLNMDPLFVNPAQNDFHLAVESPARHAGIDAALPADFDGDSRGGASGVDLGAFQFVVPNGTTAKTQ